MAQYRYKCSGLNERIRALRKAKGIPQRTLSDIMGMSETYIHLIENGKREPSLAALISLCYTLECSPNTLLAECLPENMFGELPILREARFLSPSPVLRNTLTNWLNADAPDECLIDDVAESPRIDLQKLPPLGFLGFEDEMPDYFPL